jgi:hypothetical protein
VKTLCRTLAAAALLAASACGGGTIDSSVPGSQSALAQSPQSSQQTVQTATRTTSDRDGRHHRHARKDVDYGYELFDDAVFVHPGHDSKTAVQASYGAEYPASNADGGVDFAFPAGATYSQLQNLSSDYKFTVGTCGQGAPRFVVTLTNGTVTGNINFYFGTPPNYTGCPPNVWSNTGNLAGGLVDDSQLPGGTFYDPYSASQVKFGSYAVTDIFVVVDGYASSPPAPPNANFRTVQWDNVGVTIGTDNEIYTFENHGPDKGFTDGD